MGGVLRFVGPHAPSPPPLGCGIGAPDGKQTYAASPPTIDRPAAPPGLRMSDRGLRPLLGRLWQQILVAGRALAEEEVAPDLLSEIQSQVGSLRRAERLANSCFDVQALKAATNARREDLLVYFGLNLFNGRTRYSGLPAELQRDIKVFFENATSAFEGARALLFSVGKPEVIDESCRQAASTGLGFLSENHSLQLHSSEINRLPATLRCYVGCGAKLYGDVAAGADDRRYLLSLLASIGAAFYLPRRRCRRGAGKSRARGRLAVDDPGRPR